MTLPTNLTDYLDNPIDAVITGQITDETTNDWGYGLSTGKILFDSPTPTITFHTTEANATNNVVASTPTQVTTVPTAGQIRVHYATPNKLGWIECNSADANKWIRYAGKIQGSLINAKQTNAQNAAINAGGGSGFVEFKLKSATPEYSGNLANTANIELNMTKEVDSNTLSNIVLKDNADATVTTTNSLDTDTKKIIVNPSGILANVAHKLYVYGGIKSADGEVLGHDIIWPFTAIDPINYLTVPFLEEATSALSAEWASDYVTGTGSSVSATSGKMRFNVVTVSAWQGVYKGLTKPIDISAKKSIKFDCTKLGTGTDQWALAISDTNFVSDSNLPNNGIRMWSYNGSGELTKYTAGGASGPPYQSLWSGATGQVTNIELILDNSGANTIVTVKEGASTLLTYDIGYKLSNLVYVKFTAVKNATSASTTIDFDNISITNA